jgi:hypothetical protein
MVRLGFAIAPVGLAGVCGEIGQPPDIARPPVLGKPFVAGAGGTVMEVSAAQTTTGTPYVPPSPSAFTPNQAGQIQLAAPPGGSVIVDGRRINFLRPVEGGIEYSVN